VEEDQQEEGEAQEHLEALEAQEDKVCPEDQEIQENQGNLAVQEEHILRMISGKYVLLS